jgi:hypothetical protein
MLSSTAAAAGEGSIGSVGSALSRSARCLAVFFIGRCHIESSAAALAKDLLMHGNDQQQQQQQQENVPAAANTSCSSSSQQIVEPGNWLMLIGRGCITTGYALEQCCAPDAAAAAITLAASATESDEPAAAAAAQLDNTEWLSDSEHPLCAMQHISAVTTWLGLALPLLLPSYAAGMKQQLMQQQEQLLASLQQLTAALQAVRLDDVLASSSQAELNIAAVTQTMHAVNAQGQGGQLLRLSQQLSSCGAGCVQLCPCAAAATTRGAASWVRLQSWSWCPARAAGAAGASWHATTALNA